MKRKTNLLIAACMALSPALTGTGAATQTFEKLFEWAPDSYADINDDGAPLQVRNSVLCPMEWVST